MRKLEIGAGSSRLGPEWETSDIRPGCDYQVAAWEIDTLGKNEFGNLYACMVLEHIPRNLQATTLSSWFNALAWGGYVEIIVPDMQHIAELIIGGLFDEGIRLAYGDQDYPENTHVWGFTQETLRRELEKAGFCKVDVRKKNGALVAIAAK